MWLSIIKQMDIIVMSRNTISQWVWLIMVFLVMDSCGVDMPKEKQSSYETMTVQKSDIEVPVKFSAKMKGQADVTIMPQVSGQLMKIYVTEGQQVRKGQTLFVIDSRNAHHGDCCHGILWSGNAQGGTVVI